MGFVIPRFCYIGSAAIKGFNILGFRDIGFITPGVRYTGVRSTGILLDTGVPSVPYAGISLCKVHYQYQDFVIQELVIPGFRCILGFVIPGFRYILWFVALESRPIELRLTETSFYRGSLYPEPICCAIFPLCWINFF